MKYIFCKKLQKKVEFIETIFFKIIVTVFANIIYVHTRLC